MWAFVAVFTLASLSFLLWHSNSTHKQKLAAANQRLSEAVAAATEWLSAEISTNGEAIEKELADALYLDSQAGFELDGDPGRVLTLGQLDSFATDVERRPAGPGYRHLERTPHRFTGVAYAVRRSEQV